MKKKSSASAIVGMIIVGMLLFGGVSYVMSRAFPSKDKPASENTYEIDKKITDAYRSVCDAYDNSVEGSEVPQYMAALSDKTEELKRQGVITYSESWDTYVYVLDTSGVGIYLGAPVEGYSSGGDTLTYLSYQPYYDDFNQPDKYTLTDLMDQTDATFSGQSFVSSSTRIKKNRSVTVEEAKRFSANSVILWDGHGYYSNDVGSCLMLSYEAPYTENITDYLSKRLCYGYTGEGKRCTVLTPKFFDYYYSAGSLDQSVIFLSACQSGMDYLKGIRSVRSLSTVLRDKGAETVFATSETIYTYYVHEMAHSVLTGMLDGKTAGQALADAKATYGNNDYTSWTNDPTKKNAEIILLGDSSFTLSRPTVYSNSRFGWSVTIPDKWFTCGSVVNEGDYPDADQYGSVFFYHKQLHEQTGRGFIFAIIAIPVNSPRNDGVNGNTGAGGYLGTKGSYAYYWFQATDVQADPYAADYQQRLKELNLLNSLRSEIIASFRLT